MKPRLPSGIQPIHASLYLKKEESLIISDIHIGLEDAYHAKGMLLPRTQRRELKEALDAILTKVHPKTFILNGDLKHEFGKISNQEWDDLLWLIDYLQARGEVRVIEGNHDPLLDRILSKRKLAVQRYLRIGDIFICHGDHYLPESEGKGIKTIIIGHLHPAKTITDGIREEKYKCFLLGTYKKKRLIVLPSFNPLITGSEPELGKSPYLNKQYACFLIGKDRIYPL
ncbi:MAG: metallophosphoesterase [Nanoarchaeota archaeon]